MTVNLGVNHLTALETDPVQFIDIASQAGASEVSLFVNRLGPDNRFPLVTREISGAVRNKLRETGIRITNFDPFSLTPKVDVGQFEPAMELAAELGARGITALLFDNDEARLTDSLNRLCEQARQYKLRVGIEFMGLTPGWNTLETAVALIEKADQSNLGIGIDLLHLIRTGGSLASVAALDPSRISHVQICDGADLTVSNDYGLEAGSHRLAPGDGVFPLVEFLQALPAGISLELEVPQPPDRPALERVRHALEGARKVIEAAGL